MERFALGQKEMREPGYTAIYPNGRVPGLIDGEVTLTESTAIAQYLAAHHAPDLAPGPDSANFASCLQWLHYADRLESRPAFRATGAI